MIASPSLAERWNAVHAKHNPLNNARRSIDSGEHYDIAKRSARAKQFAESRDRRGQDRCL
jgi:hypothetical protein